MANHASTKKSIKKTKAKTSINKVRVNRIRTFIKKVESAVRSADAKLAGDFFMLAQSEIMKGVTKNVIKKNTAARKVSRLSKLIKDINPKAV